MLVLLLSGLQETYHQGMETENYVGPTASVANPYASVHDDRDHRVSQSELHVEQWQTFTILALHRCELVKSTMPKMYKKNWIPRISLLEEVFAVC